MNALKCAALALWLLFAAPALAFDLAELSEQLSQPEVVRGHFVQEKNLRDLPLALTSQGQFVLAKAHGLLWYLQKPLQQDFRITANNISQRTENGWLTLPGHSASAQQNRLFLAVLQGNSQALEHDFDLTLNGSADNWQLSLIPRGLLLKQVFSRIEISGGSLVERIELHEVQGDSTRITLHDNHSGQRLSEAEQHDLQD